MNNKFPISGSIQAILNFSLVALLISHNFTTVYDLYKNDDLISVLFFTNIIILLFGLRIVHVAWGQAKYYLGYFVPFADDFDEYIEKLKLRDIKNYIGIGYTFVAFFICQSLYYCHKAYYPTTDNEFVFACVQAIILFVICVTHFFRVKRCYTLLRLMALSDEINDRKLSVQSGEKCTKHKDKRIKEFLEEDDE